MMLKAVKLLLIINILMIVGCVNEESSESANLKTSTVDQIQQELDAVKAQFQAEKSTYEAQIKELKEENIEIQNVAMKTIMTMLEKQIAYDNKIQDKLKGKIATLKSEKENLQAKVQQLECQISTQNQVKVSDAQLEPMS